MSQGRREDFFIILTEGGSYVSRHKEGAELSFFANIRGFPSLKSAKRAEAEYRERYPGCGYQMFQRIERELPR